MDSGIASVPTDPRPTSIDRRLEATLILVQLVREARKRAGLTQAQLAERAGVSRSTVCRIESGTRVPSTELLERLVRAAGFEIRVALGEPDPGTESLFERTLRLTPRERLAHATRLAHFVLRGRQSLRGDRPR